MSYSVCSSIKKTRVSHKCCYGHVIPAGQNCYKYNGVEDGSWYCFFECGFCKTLSNILNVYEINNKKSNIYFNNEESNLYSDLEYFFNLNIKPENIDLSKKIVSFFIQNDIGISVECITMSFEEFYSFFNRRIYIMLNKGE